MEPGTPAQNVTAVPLQFHFHAHSEHTINGEGGAGAGDEGWVGRGFEYWQAYRPEL